MEPRSGLFPALLVHPSPSKRLVNSDAAFSSDDDSVDIKRSSHQAILTLLTSLFRDSGRCTQSCSDLLSNRFRSRPVSEQRLVRGRFWNATTSVQQSSSRVRLRTDRGSILGDRLLLVPHMMIALM